MVAVERRLGGPNVPGVSPARTPPYDEADASPDGDDGECERCSGSSHPDAPDGHCERSTSRSTGRADGRNGCGIPGVSFIPSLPPTTRNGQSKTTVQSWSKRQAPPYLSPRRRMVESQSRRDEYVA